MMISLETILMIQGLYYLIVIQKERLCLMGIFQAQVMEL